MSTCFKVGFAPSAATALLASLLLSACPTGPQRAGTGPGEPVTQPPAGPTGSKPYRGHEGNPYDVVSGESLLTIVALKGGALAKAGHNHVIASHDVAGTIYVPGDITRSTFELHVPVAALTIDEDELRAREGAEFPANVPDSAKEGTRRNMLSEALLNAAQYPDITLMCDRIETGGAAAQAHVRVIVRGQSHDLTVPVRYELHDGRLGASGELSIRQSELGLTPFSAMLGALQVQDELHVRFRILALAAQIRGAAKQ
jgi:polyisoprenoid-binding protein YceI